MSVKMEEITPKVAESMLKQSKGNRRLNEGYVLTLACAMESGTWQPEAGEIVFDSTGALIDGHHRLNAIAVFGRPVAVLVKRGVDPAVRNVIDTGRTRSLSDLMTMYRPGGEYVSVRRAMLQACLDLYVGESRSKPQLRTLDVFDQWHKQFREGIDWVIEAIGGAGLPNHAVQPFRVGPVAGAFAFAHKTNPAKIEAFVLRCLNGVSLSAGEPALTLRNLVLARRSGRGDAGARKDLMLKVLGATWAHLRGEGRYTKAQTNSGAVLYFRQAYGGRALVRLARPWSAGKIDQQALPQLATGTDE